MTEGLIESIEAAESEAERICAEAEEKAIELILAAEETCRAQEREAADATRISARYSLAQARAVTEDEIHALELRRAFEREALRELALNRVELAAKVIFEKVMIYGDS